MTQATDTARKKKLLEAAVALRSAAIEDMKTLGPIRYQHGPRTCTLCHDPVQRYGSTPDHKRHYCRPCVSLIMSLIRPPERTP